MRWLHMSLQLDSCAHLQSNARYKYGSNCVSSLRIQQQKRFLLALAVAVRLMCLPGPYLCGCLLMLCVATHVSQTHANPIMQGVDAHC
jgi:hypothetical protein